MYPMCLAPQDFRLWVTTEPTDAFPLAILQQSLKVVTEPAAGLRRNMKGNYSKLSDSALSECSHEVCPSHTSVLLLCLPLHKVLSRVGA
jgi:dynein heavy chain, axonemal